MRAVVVEKPGGVDRLLVQEVPRPEPGPGEVLVQVAFAACNWSDIQKRQGVYPYPVPFPVVLGLEVSGTVARVGRGVRRFRPGDRVAAITGPDLFGGYAEYCRVHQDYVSPLPEAMPLDLGAAFSVVGQTAYHLLHTAHAIRKGETVLIHAVGGGVGLMTLQLALAAGARVMGTVGGPGKDGRALEYGAHLVVDRSGRDFVAAAMEFTKGRGVDLAIDSLGGAILERTFDAMRPYGRIINIGEASGYPDFDIRPKLYERSTSLAGYEFLHAGPGSARWRRAAKVLAGGLASGRLRLPLAASFPLERVADAHALLMGRGVQGKVVLSL